MKTGDLIKLKELFDAGVITQEEYEAQKSKCLADSNQKRNKLFTVIGIVVLVFILIAIISSNLSPKDTEISEASGGNVAVQSEIKPEFADECPVTISGNISDDILGFPNIYCNVKNNSEKEVAAIQFYFVAKNVYGEEVNSVFTQNKLSFDDSIGSGSTKKCNWQLLDQEVKSGDLYLYSVYFTDGTEWGDKDASDSVIKKYGKKINVTK